MDTHYILTAKPPKLYCGAEVVPGTRATWDTSSITCPDCWRLRFSGRVHA